jgi:Uma2 family endonuclease
MMTSAQEYREAVLALLPDQGQVSEEDYLWLTGHTTRLLEFTDGYVEVLPVPTNTHQGIVLFLVRALLPYLDARGGILRFAPLRLRLRPGKFREPDLMLLLDADDPRVEDRYWHGADLVLEVVGPDRPERDLVEKWRDYAEAGIPEYWIVNPQDRSITVLALGTGAYVEHGRFAPGARATSALLANFSVAVDDVFAAASR